MISLSRVRALCILLSILLAGCTVGGVTNVPTKDTPLPSATATAQPVTDTPAPTATAAVQPATSTPVPSLTPTDTPLPTPTATAQPTSTPVAQHDWLQFNFDAQHSGNNTRETIITPGNVGSLHQLFQVSLPAVADGAPAYLSAVDTPAGVADLLFVTTKAGHIVALDAHTGRQVWVHQYPAGSCRINNGSQPCYTTSSPAIDPVRQVVYTYGLDGYVHKHRVGDGVEVTGQGWPELATLKPFNEKGSSDLSMATASDGAHYLYMANGGYPGDRGDYQGHITAINLADGSQRVFNANCSDQPVHFAEQPATPDCPAVQSAIWARAGVVYDPDLDRIYMATGNGLFDPSRYDWGDTVFALHPDGTGMNGMPLDSYTPTDYQRLQSLDADLGSTAPAILPVPDTSTIRHLALQGGKDAKLRLLNLENLSSQGGPGHVAGEVGSVIDVPQGGQVLTAPGVWVNPADGTTWAFVANGRGLSGLRLMVSASSIPALELAWRVPDGGTSPIIANNVLYYAASHDIRALDPATGRLLWHDTQIGSIHWESPIAANGILYITDESSQLTAYGP
jgi:outer membrane protein assembly factor BamB